MSALGLNSDEHSPDENAVARAIALLAIAARRDFGSVEAQLKAAGFVIAGCVRIQATRDLDAARASDLGAVVAGRGIYHGAWQPRPNAVIVHAYSDTDFLKDASGKQMLLTWYAAREELTRRNENRHYGDGTEAALRDALAKPAGMKGAYQDGDLVMAPQLLLNGGTNDGEKVRIVGNTCDLLCASNSNAFKNVSQTLKNASYSGFGRWSWSCSEDRGYSTGVKVINLSVDFADLVYKGSCRLGVFPFRFFREAHVVKAVRQLNII